MSEAGATEVGGASTVHTAAVSRETPTLLIEQMFSAQAPRAVAFHHWLATAGIERGLLGPREVPRLWERHILNSAVVSGLLPEVCAVVDVGSGAGLPGIPLALRCPGVHVTLVEPLHRRAEFLREVCADLELTNCTVLRARAEDLPPAEWDIATARAVAPLSKLLGWLLPPVRLGGRVLAIKGSSAEREVAEAEASLRKHGGGPPVVRTVGGDGMPSATVVEIPRVSRRTLRKGAQ